MAGTFDGGAVRAWLRRDGHRVVLAGTRHYQVPIALHSRPDTAQREGRAGCPSPIRSLRPMPARDY